MVAVVEEVAVDVEEMQLCSKNISSSGKDKEKQQQRTHSTCISCKHKKLWEKTANEEAHAKMVPGSMA